MRIGVHSIHRMPPPGFLAIVRKPGLGQTGTVSAALAQMLQQFERMAQLGQANQIAVGCGPSNGAPCGSPEEAAQMVYAQAAGICGVQNAGAQFPGFVQDPECTDGGQAASAAAYPQWLAFFQSLPASVWTTAAANAATGNYYGPDTAPQNTIQYGPPVNVATGAPISATPTAPIAVPQPQIVQAPQPAPVQISPASTAPPAGSSTAPAGGTPDPFAWLTNDVSILGQEVPVWGLLVGGFAALMILPSLIGGRR